MGLTSASFMVWAYLVSCDQTGLNNCLPFLKWNWMRTTQNTKSHHMISFTQIWNIAPLIRWRAGKEHSVDVRGWIG